MAERLLQQALDLWVRPEVERRRKRGMISQEFNLYAAQVIFPSPLEGRSNYVRLNEEVQAVAKVSFVEPRRRAEGDTVLLSELEDVHEIVLVEDDEPNCGHLTLMWLPERWIIAFDFARDRSRVENLLDLAEQYAASAIDDQAAARAGPAYDSLFNAAELAARAELMLFGFYPYENPKDHGAIFGRYRKWARYGNAPEEASSTLKKLSRTRFRARYLEHDEPWPDFEEAHQVVSDLILHVQSRLPGRAAVPARLLEKGVTPAVQGEAPQLP